MQALLGTDAEIVLALTQPDRPAGRGRKLQPSPVKKLALEHAIPVHQPLSLKTEANLLRGYKPDIIIVAAYGLLIPPPILSIPPLGCINVHASLLPRWRGAAPIARAIEAGDTETGITLMQMDAGLDTGAILMQQSVPILETDTAQRLHDKLATLGAQSLSDALPKIKNKSLQPREQDDDKATYAAKITKAESLIDWTMPARTLACKIRAMNPWPVCHTFHNGNMIKIWQAASTNTSDDAPPGTVAACSRSDISIHTGSGILQATVLQRPGGKPLACGEFLNGYPLSAGDRLQNS